MIAYNESPSLPPYDQIMDVLGPLNLPLAISEIHGMICGYLCAGAGTEGEHYLRSLLNGYNQEQIRMGLRCLFELSTLSDQQLKAGDFAFNLLLPDEQENLLVRAQAFSEWCEGFTQGMTMVGVGCDDLQDTETQDAFNHIFEFARLDYEALDVSETDEKALVEVSEYTRMAVLRLHHDLHTDGFNDQDKAH